MLKLRFILLHCCSYVFVSWCMLYCQVYFGHIKAVIDKDKGMLFAAHHPRIQASENHLFHFLWNSSMTSSLPLSYEQHLGVGYLQNNSASTKHAMLFDSLFWIVMISIQSNALSTNLSTQICIFSLICHLQW